jgi:opacity protein-like surface antigen
VVGIEGDVSFPNFLAGNDVVATLKSEHATYREQFDCLGTLRSRVGYAWNGQWLGYVTGGLVWSRARFSETPSDENTAAEKARWLTGYGLGLGTEAGIAQRWTARIEFVHDELVWGEAQFVSGVAVISKIHVNSLRLGLGWLP